MLTLKDSIRPTEATIDLEAFRHNLTWLRDQWPTQRLAPVLKADAYGHGLTPIAAETIKFGVPWIAVATVEEGLLVRQLWPEQPILVIGGLTRPMFEPLIEHRLTPLLYDVSHLDWLAQARHGARLPTTVGIHLHVDTGMTRLGLPERDLSRFLEELQTRRDIVLEGLASHLANADLDDGATNTEQLARFAAVRSRLAEAGYRPTFTHIANSAGALGDARTHTGLLRPGLALFGLDPRGAGRSADLRPVMRWTSRPVGFHEVVPGTPVGYGGRWRAPRQSRLVILPVGYADGYPRAAGGRAQVLVKGRRCPVVGAVSMDLIAVDVTDVDSVSYEDEVVLLGRQGTDQIDAHQFAGWVDSIPFEVLCRVGQRVPRRYLATSR